jgi:hypothetical protein
MRVLVIGAIISVGLVIEVVMIAQTMTGRYMLAKIRKWVSS